MNRQRAVWYQGRACFLIDCCKWIINSFSPLHRLRTSQDEFLARCFQATDFLEPYESTTRTLESAEPAFSVNFEFLGTDNDLLRLEAEFARCPGATEYEITQRRWLRPRGSGQASDKRSPLQISVVDFERYVVQSSPLK